MKKKLRKVFLGISAGLILVIFFVGLGLTVRADTAIYRLYNHNTGEHFYTANQSECSNIINAGWDFEGTGWTAPSSGAAVYRLYNPHAKGGDHYYTQSKFEGQSLVKYGWRWDNAGKAVFYSGGNTSVYVAYNPQAGSGSHNYTTSSYEQNSLLRVGWRFGAVAWQAVASGQTGSANTVVLPYNPNYHPNSANITNYAVSYIRELRQINGIKMPISANTSMLNAALQDVAALDKSGPIRDQAAGKKPGENGYANAAYYGYADSDQETAYMLIKNWFDEKGNVDSKTYPYGHRATLLYGGTGMGLAVSNKGSSSMEFTGTGDWDAWQKINKGALALPLPTITFNYI